jgi:CRP-like cAMP-binding protein
MTTMAELRERANDALYGGAFDEALRLYGHIVELQPSNLDARLRVGDALLAKGEVQRAAVVYTALAKHAALAGYPLRALVAIKILQALEPALGALLGAVGELYGRDSKRVGASVRRSQPDTNQQVPAGTDSGLPLGDDLAERAERIAARYAESDLFFPEKLMPIPVLSLLDTSELGSALDAVRLVRARPGQCLIEQDTPGGSFFVLARGSVRVAQRPPEGEGERELAVLPEGVIIGEMALLSTAPRTASVYAQGDCDLLEFEVEALRSASKTIESLGRALSGFAQERLLNNVMAQSGVFQPLDFKQRHDLLRRFISAEAPASSLLVRQGQPGKGLYVILRGQVAVLRDNGDTEEQLALLGPGDTFGEISLLNEGLTTASVRATQPTTVLFLGREYCTRLIEAVPEIRTYLERMAEERAMQTFRRTSRVEVPAPEDVEVEVLL